MARNAQAAAVSSWNGVEWYSTDRSATQTALAPYDRAPSPADIPSPPPHITPSPSDPIASSSTATPSPKAAPDANRAESSPGKVTSSYTAQAMLECHYCHHDGFLADRPILSHVDALRHIPCIAVHGALDYLCPVRTAWDLHREYPEVRACVIPSLPPSVFRLPPSASPSRLRASPAAVLCSRRGRALETRLACFEKTMRQPRNKKTQKRESLRCQTR